MQVWMIDVFRFNRYCATDAIAFASEEAAKAYAGSRPIADREDEGYECRIKAIEVLTLEQVQKDWLPTTEG